MFPNTNLKRTEITMRLLKLLLALALCLILSVSVFAHPGGTDSSGGHYRGNTGEYHYHHGYPAHQHYDKDGDGILDCPYDFDDKTGSSSGSNKSSSKTPSKSSSKNEPSAKTPTKSTSKIESSTNKNLSQKVKDYFSEIFDFISRLGISVGVMLAPYIISKILGLLVRLLKWIFRC